MGERRKPRTPASSLRRILRTRIADFHPRLSDALRWGPPRLTRDGGHVAAVGGHEQVVESRSAWRSGPCQTTVHPHSPDPPLSPLNLRQLAFTPKSDAAIGGRPSEETWRWTRLANVGAIAPSMRVDVMGLAPQPSTANAVIAVSVERSSMLLVESRTATLRCPAAAACGRPLSGR